MEQRLHFALILNKWVQVFPLSAQFEHFVYIVALNPIAPDDIIARAQRHAIKLVFQKNVLFIVTFANSWHEMGRFMASFWLTTK